MHEFMTFILDAPSGILYCLGLLAIGIWLLTKGGGYLVTGGLGLAKQLNIKTMVVGLTIIAFSTSSPELAFNVFAASGGYGEITIGNIFGSNIANLALILGIGALVHNSVRRKRGETEGTPIDRLFLKKEGAWLLGATFGVFLLTTAILVWGNNSESWLQLNWGWGLFILFIFIVFFWHVVVHNSHSNKKVEGNSDDKISKDCSLSKAILLLIGGLLLLTLGGKATEIGAVVGARIIGISEMFIGVTIVAIATSLPELVTTIIAAKRDEADLIWGNIVGSNLFNILFVLPIALVVAAVAGGGFIEIPSPSYEPWFYMAVMLFVTCIAWIMMWRKDDITDKEGYSLVGIYVVFLIVATIWKSIG